MSARSRLRWVLPLLRYGLCAAAIAYLIWKVPWYDHARLADGRLVQLVADRGETLDIVDGGQERTISRSQLHRLSAGGPPDIEYGIKTVVQRVHGELALWAILMFLPVPILQSVRLVWMLGIQDVRLSLWNSVKFSLAGNFFNFALPGTVGGDLVKAYYLTRITRHKTEAVTTVFLDRAIGLLGLIMLATVTFMVSAGRVEWDERLYRWIAILLAVLWAGMIVGSVIVFSRRLRNGLGLPQLAARLPAGEQLLRIGRATVAMRQHPMLVLLSLANTFVLQGLVVLSAWFMALALGMRGDAVLYFICVPIGFLIAAVPISPPQAFGVMEAAYLQFFTHGGLNTDSQAFAFALAVRLIQLVWALPGVLVPMLGAHMPKRAELEALERDDPEQAA
jgi:hypothetical protein